MTQAPPTQTQIEQMNLICNLADHFINNIQKICPDSREKSLAMTKIEECLMWCQQCILRHGQSQIQIVPAGAIKQ